MLEKKHLVFLAGATAPSAPPLCTALTAVVNTHIRSVRPYARERHVLTQLRLLTGEYLATDLTKVTLNQILSQTTFQAFIPGLPAWPCALFQYVITTL